MTSIAFEASGRVKCHSAEELAEADKEMAILGYVHGTMEDGRPYYAYVAIKPSKYKEFHALTTARKAMVIGHYGTVVAAGLQSEPPPAIAKKMRDVYGFDEQYEAKLKQEALREKEKFFENQEKVRLDDIVAMLKNKKPNSSTT
jgi:hypothetical protein